MNWRYLVGALALMMGLAACGEDDASKGGAAPTCGAGDTLCGSSCVDTDADPRHCGACGVTCAAGEICSDGACTASCPAGQELCDGGCYDLDANAQHCGACGVACAEGQACADGACVAACPDGQTACDGGCFDLDASSQHCGACGTTCGTGEVCSDGACAASCPAGQVACDGACVDTASSDAHCGACGVSCGDGELCVDGACTLTCATGQTACDGSCANLATDRANCGACGTVCGADELCIDGACELTCAAGSTECNGACVDTDVDRANCGACGTTCDTGEICSAGACVPFCGAFAPDVCGDACTSLQNDPLNCGACGNACAAGQVCSAGVCADSCAPGADVCADGCTDFDHDPANCGACGAACAPAANAIPVCATGACDNLCMPGYADCNGDLASSNTDGCEMPLNTAPDNCGACGNVCPTPANGIAACIDGACGVAQCDDGWADCDGDPSNGCEANLNDAATCGACGVTCDPALGESCVAGACELPGPGDQCSLPLTLTPGQNSLAWAARGQEYLTSQVSCNNSGPAGADIVMRYTATRTGGVKIGLPKTASNLLHLVVSDAPCGTVDELRCHSDYTNAGLEVSFPVTQGETYHLYLVRGSRESYIIPQPLVVDVTEYPTADGVPPGESCANPFVLGESTNSFAWTAQVNDYFDGPPSCGTYSDQLTGPDLVFKYTAAHDGAAEVFLDRSSGKKAFVVVQEGVCGTIDGPLACSATVTGSETRTVFPVVAGRDYYLHVIATGSGYSSTNMPLLNPLGVRVNPIVCGELVATVDTLEPLDGTLLTTPTPEFKATLSHSASTERGTVTITGDKGTSETITLPSPQVKFSADAKTITITPTSFLRSNEVATVVLDLVTADCGTPFAPKQWKVTAPSAICTPGVDGMVGTTMTRVPVPAAGSMFTEYYVAADSDPNGWVYVGGTAELLRVPKAGGRFEDIGSRLNLTGANHLGATMLIDGPNIYVVNDNTSFEKRFWRLSTDGGATWDPTDFAKFGTSTSNDPEDDFRGAAIHGGKAWFVTNELTLATNTEIWSVDLAGGVGVAAVKELSFGGGTYRNCTGLAMDASSFFTTCQKGSEYALLRIARAGGAITELSTTLPGNTTAMAIHVADRDADGNADYVYLQDSREEGHFLCGPYSGAPYVHKHFSFGTGSSNYGMGFDPVENALWAFDDDTIEFVKIK